MDTVSYASPLLALHPHMLVMLSLIKGEIQIQCSIQAYVYL